MKDRLIGLHNHQVQFSLGKDVYIIPRDDIEAKFNLYWFIGGLYKSIIRSVLKEKDWLNKYKL